MNDALRRHRRCPVNVIARIRVDPDGEFEARCATDLSLGGLKMVLDQELEPGYRVHLEFRPLQSRGRIEAVAAVRWCRPQGEHFAAGLEFVGMDQTSRDRFQEALDVLEERSQSDSIHCLSEAVIETGSVEEFASSYGTDMSDGRLQVSTDEPFQPGAQLLVVVRTGAEESMFRADSVVCSCEPDGDRYSVGVRFWYLDEASRRFVEHVDATLRPESRSGRWHGVDEEAWFEEGEFLSGLHSINLPKASIRRWPLVPKLGIGVAGVGTAAAAALALFVVFRGPAVEGQPSGTETKEATGVAASVTLAEPVVARATVTSETAAPAIREPAKMVAMEVGKREVEPVSSGGRILAVGPVRGHRNQVEILADVDLGGRFDTRVIEGPRRFLVDISGVKRSSGLKSWGRVGRLIRRYRVGRHPDMVRVVLDLAGNGSVDVAATGHRLVLTMN